MISSYLREAIDKAEIPKTVDRTIADLAAIDFDTIAVRGISGLAIGAIVAYKLGKALCVVRKTQEGSHAFTRVEGEPGQRYVIIDDFICTGETVKEIIDAMRGVCLVGFYGYQHPVYFVFDDKPPTFERPDKGIKIAILNKTQRVYESQEALAV